ncbi:MAG: Hsp20/alpha crystallin family protein [Acidobacteriota bacterium]
MKDIDDRKGRAMVVACPVEKDMPRKKEDDDKIKKVGAGLGGLFSGLTEIIEKLGELAEKGDAISKDGSFDVEGKKGLKGSYGFTIRTGLGGDRGPTVEPVRKPGEERTAARSEVQEVREPSVDIFDEDGYTLIVAEMPGIDAEDIQYDVSEDILTLHAEGEDKTYHKEILLPGACPRDRVSISSKNGIVEIRCDKQQG